MMGLFYRVGYRGRRLYRRLAKAETCGVKVLVVGEGQLLFVRHSYGARTHWTLPGGGFRPAREAPEEAGRREVREETGLALTDVRLVGQYVSTAEGHRDTVFCLVGQAAGCAVRLSGELSAAEWFAPEALPAPLDTAAWRTLEFWQKS